MSEIKDNKGIEEVRQNGSNQPENLCCTCQTGPTTITNESQCQGQCCTPKTIVCPDIREAKCIPALIDRIYDYVYLKNEQTNMKKEMEKHHKVTMRKLDKLREFDEIADMTNTVFEKRFSNIEQSLLKVISK